MEERFAYSFKNNIIKKYWWMLSVVFFLFTGKVHSQETIEVGGVLTGNTVWTKEFIYIVNEDVIVSPTVKLEIEAGVEVRFNQGRGLLVVGGQLSVNGTEEEMVKMIPNHIGVETWNWNGITISSIYQEGRIFINYSIIHKAVIGIRSNSGNHLVINNNTFLENRNVGISLINSSNCLVENNNIHENFLGLEIFSSDPNNNSSNNEVLRNHFSNITTNLIIHNSNHGGLTGNIISGNLIEGGVHGIWLYKGGHIGNGNVTITQNIIINIGTSSDGYGIYVAMDSTYITKNIFWQNTTAVSFREVNYCVLTNNNLYQNGRAVELRNGATKINMLQNTITGIESEVLILNQHAGVVFNDNNLFANKKSEMIVKNNTSVDIPINGNFWGTNDPFVIDQLIFDKNDDPLLGEFIYQPTLQKADTNAPIAPPSDVRAQLVNGSIKLSWRKNPESDLAGYRVNWGNFEHYKFTLSSEVITDTVFHLQNYSIEIPIAITALDKTAEGVINQLSGNESPFAFATLLPYAGQDSTICKNESVFLINQSTIPMAYDFVIWETDGDGTFNNPTDLKPTYLIGSEDYEKGQVNLKLSVTTNSLTISDSLTLYFAEPPFAFAGNSIIIPPDSIFTSTVAIAENYEQLLWTTLGDGVFSDNDTLNPVYFPGTQDILNESVQLILEVSNMFCQSFSDTLTLIIRQQYNVSGRVWADQTLQNNAPVIAVRLNENGDKPMSDISFTDEFGNFKFNNLFAGEYVFYAVIDTSNVVSYMPAYHPNKERWREAYVHDLKGDIYEIDIRLPIIEQQLPIGEGSISGKFLLPNYASNTFDTYCQPWFKDENVLLCSEGLSNITIFLIGTNSNIVYDYTLTNNIGKFLFTGLPFGTYRIQAEVAGFDSETSSILTLSPDNSTVTDVLLNIEAFQKIGIYIPNHYKNEKNFSVYPNPSSNVIHVDCENFEGDELYNLTIFNFQGQKVQQTDIQTVNDKISIDITNLRNGVYQAKIMGQEVTKAFVFIKSN
jgi:parallel beta-helix repeat protein